MNPQGNHPIYLGYICGWPFYLFKKYFPPGRGEPVGGRWVDTEWITAEYPLKLLLWLQNHIVIMNIIQYLADIWIKHSTSLYYLEDENTMFDLNWSKLAQITSAVINRWSCSITEKAPIMGPSPVWKRLLALSHLRHY